VVKPENPTVLRALSTVFLDRDGVVNEKMPENFYVTSWEQFRLLPGVVEAISRLNRAGMRVIVVSNQRGVARGLYTEEDVRAIHSQFQSVLKTKGAHVDAFYFCPHEKGQCNCRKPLPGLFESAIAEFPDITAVTSVMIGDSHSDIEFGKRLGLLTVFIEGAPERQKPGSEEGKKQADLVFSSLGQAVDFLLLDRPQATQIP
jgi:D-glycero-D-manno-heptose 1,7-bisphosphate phosphatase